MKYYCKRCHKLYEDRRACPDCNGVLTKNITAQDTVSLVSAFGIEKDRIAAALTDADIPYALRPVKKEISARAVTGIDNARYNIEVPFSYYDNAMETLIGINAIEPEEYIDDGDTAEKPNEEFEEMAPGKRMLVRVVSAILFIVLVALVIFGTDYVMGFFKNLFV